MNVRDVFQPRLLERVLSDHIVKQMVPSGLLSIQWTYWTFSGAEVAVA
jgi:hypothetical protein